MAAERDSLASAKGIINQIKSTRIWPRNRKKLCFKFTFPAVP